MALPISPSRAPGLTLGMPFHIASWVRRAQALGGDQAFADHEHAAGVAVPAVMMTVMSGLTMSPFFSGLSFGDAVADHLVDRGADRLPDTA